MRGDTPLHTTGTGTTEARTTTTDTNDDGHSDARPAPALVLATDLDGTFLGGSDRQRAALYEDLRARSDDLLLVFVTGRDLGFVTSLFDDPQMPRPDVIIGDVGTTVVHGHDLSPITAVQSWIDERWDDADDFVKELLDGRSGLRLQSVVGGRRVSYYYDPHQLDPAVIDLVEDAGFDVVRSADVFFDVLPRGIAKGPTLLRVLDELDLPDEAVLVAGDTLNDLSLFMTGLRGVAVGNAEPALLEVLTDLPEVHRSPHPGCAGIADAIEHFGFFASV